MIQHHVYFWLKEEFQSTEHTNCFENSLSTLCKIPQIQKGGWGKPAPTEIRPVTDNSYHYALYLTFESISKHDEYQVHLDHDLFIANHKNSWEKVQVRDIEE